MKIKLFLIAGFIFSVLVSCNSPAGNAKSESAYDSVPASANETSTNSNTGTPDYSKLTGTWVRVDGGKSIRINGTSPDGKLDAEYFNPKPIHVGQAEWLIKDNRLVVIVELQDVNYPGSRYALEFFPAEDELAGIYYQAVDKENFEVGFVRQK